MKDINELTIKEFERYEELLKEDEIDLEQLFKVFNIKEKFNEMSIKSLREYENKISEMSIKKSGVKKIYKINNRRFKAHLNLTNFSAAQFIDFQMYNSPFDLKSILSVVLIPQERKYFSWKTKKYNEDYDIFEVQDFLYNNFTIGEANNLSNFFFQSSIDLLKVMKGYLEKKTMKKKLKTLQSQKRNLK